MKKGIKKVLTLGLVGLTLAGATVAPVSAAEKTQSETKQVMQAQARSIASFRTFKVGDGTWSVKLTGLPNNKSKNVAVYVIRGGKEYFMRSMNEWSSVAWFSGGMKSFNGNKLVKIKTGDKLKVVVRAALTDKTIYNVTTSAKY
ncbi:hypothetical protein [Terrisporobacter petrolearius]|uniref:hypothetical protein n=1 Tax=Terrisporobacter petrolearius TaxID=1460447 RepID=UPI003B00D684